MPFDPETLRYNADGLIPVIVQDHASREVLMMAWMNATALGQSLATQQMTYWSRSRGEYWVKGATSGHRQRLVEMRYDCDGDCLLALIEQTGAACHTGRRSCFFTAIRAGEAVEIQPAP